MSAFLLQALLIPSSDGSWSGQQLYAQLPELGALLLGRFSPAGTADTRGRSDLRVAGEYLA